MDTHESNDPLGLGPDESARLKELKDALEGEFLANESNTGDKAAIQNLEELKPDFLGTIKHVVKHSDSYALRAKVAMWGMDKLLDQGKAKKDDLVELIEGMERARQTSAPEIVVPRQNNEDGS